ncbi:MAG: TIGR00268 family protein, partial [Deltaproteobacteria bacterium]|nr:TIGR00268 family protein [Deltaproteobacteria bacterium]
TDYRPGMRATQELGIRSPLQEAGLTKDEIRQLSREIGLQTWDKPSCACLASRFPYGQAINEKLLRMVGKAEDYLRDLDFTQVRVRHLGDTAKIELLPEDIARAQNDNNRIKIVKYLKDLGYTYITLDLEGYRTGSMNEVLKDKNTGDRIQKPE